MLGVVRRGFNPAAGVNGVGDFLGAGGNAS